MELRTLLGTELKASKICLGTMTFGEQNTESEAHQQLNYAVAQGINFIDTAEMYPVPAKATTQGLTESYIGSWLTQQPRDRLIIASKVAGPNRGMEWMRGGPQLNKSQIIAACEESLKRLKTDYLDLYQIHWPARHVPMFGQTYYEPQQEYPHAPSICEQLEAMAQLVDAGKVRYIGVSNESAWGISEFIKVAENNNLPLIKTIQNVYNLINRNYDHNLSEVCHRESISLLAYSPLAFGLLSGKYLDNPQASGRMTQFANFGVRYLKPHVTPAIAAYHQLAQAHGLNTAQMALAWLYSRWYVTSTIIGATTLSQLAQNIACHDLHLSDDVIAGIEEIHRRCTSPAQ